MSASIMPGLGSTDVLLATNLTLVAFIGYMLRHYFARVEAHLKENHRLISLVAAHELKLEAHERWLVRHEKALEGLAR